MNQQDHKYQTYLAILKEELVPALGCTEPIAIAYASAKAKELLGDFPDTITVAASGNIIKNVKGVIVPQTGNLRGIEASAILGALAGTAAKKLEVLTNVQKEDVEKTKTLLAQGICQVQLIPNTVNLHIIVTMQKGPQSTLVEIKNEHTAISRMEKNGEILFQQETNDPELAQAPIDRSLLTVADIYDFAQSAQIADVKEILDAQIEYNTRIAEEGLQHAYGANVGATLLESYGEDIITLAKAYPAAGSDARMSGCVMPVIINSGSGNQGMAASLPVIKYAQHLAVTQEKLYRALLISNLVAIHQKTGIGRLSAYCGAVSAACGSGAAITYLYDGNLAQIEKTITNTLANVSGIVCDGAKPSCAAKIASAVDAAIMAHNMAIKDKSFQPGEGIVKENVEKTIQSIGKLGRDGMKETDTEILRIMIDEK